MSPLLVIQSINYSVPILVPPDTGSRFKKMITRLMRDLTAFGNIRRMLRESTRNPHE